ncbi:MAG: TonB-dependent receptor [Bacteroidota bacterium]
MKNTLFILLIILLNNRVVLSQKNASSTDSLLRPTTLLNPVIISANRQATFRSEAPISIFQLNSQKIKETNANLLTELLNKVPGVVMASFNHEQHTIAIRQPIGLNPYFLYLEDGIPIRPMGIFQNNGLIEINQSAIENIEVIKGPSSSLYGPEAAGGAINFNSINSSEKNLYSIGFQHDSFGYFQSKAKYSGKISNKLGIAVAGLFSKQKNGWQPASDYSKFGLNTKIDYTINNKTKLILAVSNNIYDAQAGGSVDSVTFYSRKFVSQADFAYRKISAHRARLTLEKQWNSLNFSQIHLIARQNKIGQFPAYSIRRITGNAANAHGEINENSFKSIGFIFQNTKEFSSKKIKLINGLSADYAPNDYWAYYVRLNRDTKTGVYTVNKERPDSMLVNYQAKILNLATYAQLDWDIMPKLKMTLGARYDLMSYNFDNALKSSAFSGAPDEKNNFNRFTPKIGFTHEITDKIGGYFNASQGFSPPNISQLYRGVKVPELKAAVFSNYELGAWASLLNNKIMLEASIYYMPSKNEVVRFVNADNSVENKSAGSAIHKGIEYAITFQPNGQWKLSLNGTNARHIYEKFRLSDKQIFDGNEMPLAPHFTGMTEIQYKPNWLKGFRIASEWQMVGQYFKDNENKNIYDDRGFANLKGLSILHLRAGFHLKQFELFANLMNVTNELYTTYISRSTFGSNFYPAPPRNLTLGISWGNF